MAFSLSQTKRRFVETTMMVLDYQPSQGRIYHRVVEAKRERSAMIYTTACGRVFHKRGKDFQQVSNDGYMRCPKCREIFMQKYQGGGKA
jgi:hypothetical protein